MTDREIEILLVEDNAGDVVLTREAMNEAGIGYRLSVVRDGVEAMDFLLRRAPYASAPRPNLILLDLNLPRMNGREVIAQISDHPSLRSIPLVVLTSSRQEQHVVDECELERCLYAVKAPTFDACVDTMREIERFWINVAPEVQEP